MYGGVTIADFGLQIADWKTAAPHPGPLPEGEGEFAAANLRGYAIGFAECGEKLETPYVVSYDKYDGAV